MWQWNMKLYVSVTLFYDFVGLLSCWLVICYLVWLLVVGLLPYSCLVVAWNQLLFSSLDLKQ
jgi:hypothetical protein